MNSHLPSPTEAWQRLRDANPPSWVIGHAACVTKLALAMGKAAQANGTPIDLRLVEAGAILHDIGRSLTQDPTHACKGARILEDEGFPPPLVAIVRKHTGAGMTDEEAAGLGLPEGDYMPATLEEKIVAHADNLYSGEKRLSLEQLEQKYLAKGLAAAFRRIEQLEEELGGIIGIAPQSVEA